MGSWACVGSLINIAAGDHFDDRQAELLGELKIAVVMGGAGEDGACAVAHQHVVCDPNGYRLIVDRVDRVAAGKNAGFGVVRCVGLAIAIAAIRRVDAVRLYRVGLVRCRHAGDERMLRGEYQVGSAKQRIWPGGEDLDRIGTVLHGERNRRAFRPADPVALHLFHAFRPIEIVEASEEALCVVSDF